MIFNRSAHFKRGIKTKSLCKPNKVPVWFHTIDPNISGEMVFCDWTNPRKGLQIINLILFLYKTL